MLLPALLAAAGPAWASPPPGAEQDRPAMLSAVPFTDVRLDDGFWSARIETNRVVTIPYCLDRCRETGRLDNFARAAGRAEGPHVGHRFNDSDVFKVIEGAAYSLSVRRDAALEQTLDDLIVTIAAAQEDDGYLFTARTIDPGHPAPDAGPARWSYLRHSHELYNAGHLYEAAVAYLQATGKRALLEVAVRNADLIDREFGPGRRTDPPGHEEIEIGLVKLYGVTGERRYLDLAKFFIDARGRVDGRESYGVYAQDHVPVTEQVEPAGHAVRAMYLYSAMADVAALTGDAGYRAALDRIWESLTRTRLYLTGGIGARQSGESFGEAFELPNESAYGETCAAVGNALFNHRMNLVHRDARYADVLERVLYNGFLAGVSLSGDRFFYPNPLASDGSYERSPWFSCACCPVNVARFVPSIPGYAYAHGDGEVFVNLFLAGSAAVPCGGGSVTITLATGYPWEGRVRLTVDPHRENLEFTLHVRIPGWARGEPVPGGLYEYVDESPGDPSVTLNGARPAPLDIDRGYARLRRAWRRGDTVTLDLPLAPRLVRCRGPVEADRGRLAIERGPIVYCLEAADHGGRVRHLWLPERDAGLRAAHRPDLLGGVTVVTASGFAVQRDGPGGSVASRPIELTAVPYYAWGHRGPGEMTVWIPETAEAARVAPGPTLARRSHASASHCWKGDSVAAVNDGLEPDRSDDEAIPRLTWWDHRGTTEWVQYDFDEPRWVSASSVYWFDDSGRGGCRVPESWRLLYREGDAWKPVPAPSGYRVDRDAWNRVEFDPVKTPALRLEARLRDGHSGGILEWRLD